MNLKFLWRTAAAAAMLLAGASCIYVNENLGNNFIPEDERFDVAIATFDLKEIRMGVADSLSGYSSSRITVGAVRDADFGLCQKASAFTVVPVLDTIDFGTNPRFRQFHVSLARDTVSCSSSAYGHIIQNFAVYELPRPLGKEDIYTSSYSISDFAGAKKICKGTPLYDGGDSLSFDLTEEFALKYMAMTQEQNDSLSIFTRHFPGIFISCEAPSGMGGRFNMFKIGIDVDEDYVVKGNFAELKITSDYGDRKDVDTSFLYYFGPQQRTATTKQYALNICEHEISGAATAGGSGLVPSDYFADGKIRSEGGGGVKPVISSKEIRDLVLAELSAKGIDPKTVIINRASLLLPFEFPADHRDMDLFPSVLSPTCRIGCTAKDGEGNDYRYTSYAGLTDSSVSTENQGNLDRSLLRYSPDISHHLQNILALEDGAKWENYDIWLLNMSYETVESSSNSSSMNDYYQYLAYQSYYNQMYNGYGYGYGGYGYGYGGYGYGGYGGYGDYYGYNNYYNYMLASMYASGSSTTTSTELQLDRDRYFNCPLNGPGAADGRVPQLSIVYTFVK